MFESLLMNGLDKFYALDAALDAALVAAWTSPTTAVVLTCAVAVALVAVVVAARGFYIAMGRIDRADCIDDQYMDAGQRLQSINRPEPRELMVNALANSVAREIEAGNPLWAFLLHTPAAQAAGLRTQPENSHVKTENTQERAAELPPKNSSRSVNKRAR